MENEIIVKYNEIDKKATFYNFDIEESKIKAFVINNDSVKTVWVSLYDLRVATNCNDDALKLRIHRTLSDCERIKVGKYTYFPSDCLLSVDSFKMVVYAVLYSHHALGVSEQNEAIAAIEKENEDIKTEYRKLKDQYVGLLDISNNNAKTATEYEIQVKEIESNYRNLELNFDKILSDKEQLQKENKRFQKGENSKNKVVRFLLYSTLALAGVTTARVGYVELFELHSNTPDIVFLIAVLLGAMMSVTTFFTNHLGKWQHTGLLVFFCIVEFCSMTLYFDVFNGFEWYLTFIIAFFLPVTNLILANIINHIRSGQSIY